jgi:spermidine/putrescine transport system permease protein
LPALVRVVVPLSIPGVRAGSILVFIPCVGAFLTPDLLGGGKTVMIGNLVQNQFTTARDWPFGSAVSLALMAIVVLLVFFFMRRGEEAL